MKYLVLSMLLLTIACCSHNGYLVAPLVEDSFEVIECKATPEALICFYYDPSAECLLALAYKAGEEPEELGRACQDNPADYLPGGPKFKPNEWASF